MVVFAVSSRQPSTPVEPVALTDRFTNLCKFMRACVGSIWMQWRRLDGAWWARAPHFYKWLGTGGTASRRTTNKKQTKLY